jgi:hypothetical protein
MAFSMPKLFSKQTFSLKKQVLLAQWTKKLLMQETENLIDD